ncbi:MAG: protein translocase subunit SecF [Bacillota bacterium]
MLDYVGKRKIWFIISLMLIIPGIISLLVQGLNPGIDFTGGNILNLKFEESITDGQIRQVLDDSGIGESSVKSAGERQFVIRTAEISEEKSQQLMTSMETKLGKLDILQNDKVGAVIGRELTRKAIYAVLIASALMLVYITIRFEFRFALAAVIALMHDVLIAIGLFSLLRIEVDSAFVAAALTVIGYSINDTIVVFDRIRENLKLHKKESIEETVNRSIGQTVVRSINTALTVIMGLLALLLLGGETTRVFALALLIGVIAGTYSSIFTASPIWVELTNWGSKNKKMVARTQSN